MNTIAMVALALVVLVAISIAQVYRALPLIELKRRARQGDASSKSLYKVAAYEFSSQFLLWLIASLASAGFFVLVTRKSPVWLALTSSVILIWVAYIWIPRSSINSISQFVAKALSGPISWLLQYIDPTIKRLHHLVSGGKKRGHTGLYEKTDVEKLLKQQAKQSDSRIDPIELEMIKRVMDFNDKKVASVMIPKRKVTSVELGDTLGPIVLTELHKSKQEYFPVYDKKPAEIVGVVDISTVADVSATKTARAAMTTTVTYVHEDEPLTTLLSSMVNTHQQMFVVVNNHEEYVGIVTSKNILSQLVGDEIVDDFGKRENKEAVANRFANFENESTEESKDTAELIE